MNKVIVVLGPTAVGKTKLSIELAKVFDGEIINADSTQIFKELDIATAKIKEEEKENIKHHLFDIKSIEEDYTVYDYQIDARNKIEEILKKNKTPILVGGTGLYIKAALYDYQFETTNHNLYEELTNEQLYNQLKELDPKLEIHENNRKRLVSALNYILSNNKKYSEKEKTDKILYDTIFIGLTTDRDKLYNKINKRVDFMINDGLMEEAKKIYLKNIRTKAVMTPIGYKELFNYFDNLLSLEETLNLIKQRSRKYAKRQYTWFNNQMTVNWFKTDYNNFSNTVKEVVEFIKGEKNEKN